MEYRDLTQTQIMNWFSTRGGGGVVAPAVLTDGNTVAWYDYQESVTKDASDRVSVWGDKSGLSHDLLQATGADQPLYTVNGILFDGVTEFMKAVAFTLIQPEFIYIVMNVKTWILNSVIFDGNTRITGRIDQPTSSPKIALYAGASLSSIDIPVNNYSILRVLINGANSKIQSNNSTALTGNAGTSNMGGFILSAMEANPDPRNSNIEVKEIIIRKVADATADEQAIYDYLANKYSIS